jgi:hypothetical protein
MTPADANGEQIRLNARAAISTHIVFTAIFVCMGLPVSFAARSDPGAFKIAVALLAAYVFVLVWIGRFQIILTDQTLVYKSLFGGTRRVAIEDIQSIRTQIRPRARFGPVYQLVVLLASRTGGEERLIINMKVFERRDIQRLLQSLREKTEGDARLDLIRPRHKQQQQA